MDGTPTTHGRTAGRLLATAALVTLVSCAGGTPAPATADGPDGPDAAKATISQPPPPVTESAQPMAGRSTEEAVVEDLVRAFNAHDLELLFSLFPPDDLVLEAVACPGSENYVLDEVHENQEDVREMFDDVASFTVELLEIVPRKGDAEHYAPGEVIEDGCTVNAAITVKEVVVRLIFSDGGESEEEEGELVLVSMGDEDRWYLIGPD